MARKPKIPAIAYLRTSSAANVGREKDSDRRQRGAITGYARRAGFEIIGEYYDAAISGADPIEGRPGFAALLERIDSNGVHVVLLRTKPASPAISRCTCLVSPTYAHAMFG